MRKISSGMTWYQKRMYPVVTVIVLGTWIAAAVRMSAPEVKLALAVMTAVGAVVSFITFRKRIWTLMDEVHDGRDFLLLRNRGDDERIPLSDVQNVSAASTRGVAPITLRLTRPSKFGTEITFVPAMEFTLNPFAKNPILEDLIVRVDAARAGRSR